MHLFRLDASINPVTSASRSLGDLVEAEWKRRHPGSGIARRNLAANPLSATTWTDSLSASMTAEADRTDAQRSAASTATELATELVSADALLFTVPLYNFGVSQHFKTWFDVVYTTDSVGSGTISPLQDKPAVLATTLGGNYAPGTPREGWDHSTGWLRRVLEDVWGLDLRVVQRPFTLVGVNPALDAFTETAAELKEVAEIEAQTAGITLAQAAA